MRKRSRARELALKLFYESDLTGKQMAELCEEFRASSEAGEEVQEFVCCLAGRAGERREEIDEMLGRAAENWDLDRMAAVDRAILRMGVCELLLMDDIPPSVTINEAIEIAKKYSTPESGKFVNGILDKVRRLCGR